MRIVIVDISHQRVLVSWINGYKFVEASHVNFPTPTSTPTPTA